MGYERHEDMVAPARARPELWRLAVGIVGSFVIFWILSIFLVTTVFSALGEDKGKALLEAIDAGKTLLEAIDAGKTQGASLILLLTVGFLAVGPLVLARPLHGRSALSLFGPIGRASLDFLLSLRALAILSVVLFLIPGGPAPERAMSVGAWLGLLPLTLGALFIQTTAEEVVFRGYLQSELAARFRSPLVWMVLPSLLFAAGHYAPTEGGDNALWLTALAFAFGILTSDLTARTGTLGAAMAFHFASNVLAVAVVSAQGSASGLALYLYPFGPAEASASLLWLDLAIMGVSWLVVRVALRV